MVNRDRHDIVVEILKKAGTGISKTELMREANLSFSQARIYLGNLMGEGLLEFDGKRRLRTTDKGSEFVKKCEQCPIFKWQAQKGKKGHVKAK